ncbi:MAG: hypothetical protein IJW19_07910 [Clostridia bacterium]|nr:hypothetical protein [Clostridia bacterium]
MKKIFALLLAVLLCVTVFVACDGDDTTTTEDPANTTTVYTPAWEDNTTVDNPMPDFQ